MIPTESVLFGTYCFLFLLFFLIPFDADSSKFDVGFRPNGVSELFPLSLIF